jgi:hypothetical protein
VGPGGHPRVLTLAAERLREYYWAPEKVLPSLNLANGSPRQQRTERRESCELVAQALLKFCDLVTLRVGVRREDGSLADLAVDVIAKHAGLPLRRAARALRDLQRAGVVHTVQRRELRPDGEFRSSAAIKRISAKLFAVLDLGLTLELEREKAKKRLERFLRDAARAVPETERAKTSLLLGQLRHQLERPARRQQPLRRHLMPAPPGRSEDAQRRWNQRVFDLRAQHPDWTGDQVRAEANRSLLS